MSIEIACRGIIIEDGKILLCMQRIPKRDFWCLPGGSLEWGESLEQCLYREMKEELGINAEIKNLLFVRELLTEDRHRIEFYFDCKIREKAFIFSNEIENALYFDLDDLKKISYKPLMITDFLNEELFNDIKSQRHNAYIGNVR